MIRLIRAVITLCVIGSVGAGASAAAQSAQPSRGVIVAWVDSFPAARGYAVIMRDANPANDDVIILPASGATPDALGGALVALHKLRAAGIPARQQVVTLTGLRARVVPPRIATWLTGIVQKGAQQPATKIGNIGRGRWIELPDITLGS